MNVVSVDAADTLPIIYERGLFGIYHDWCESFSTYPRTYDLLHADHLFSKVKTRCVQLLSFSFIISIILVRIKRNLYFSGFVNPCWFFRCNLVAVVAEVDRILRPEGKLIVRDTVDVISELENMVRSMQWEVRMTYSKDNEGLLCVQKSKWRPTESETLEYAIA